MAILFEQFFEKFNYQKFSYSAIRLAIKALEQDVMPCSVRSRKLKTLLRDLISLHINLMPNVFSRMFISNVHKSVIVY